MHSLYFLRTGVLTACLAMTAIFSACNGRPTYNIKVTDFKTTCIEAPIVRVEHDPDPDFHTVKVEPEYQAAAQDAQMKFSYDGVHVTAELGSEIACRHHKGQGKGTCFSKNTGDPMPCTSMMKVVAYRWPSRGQGSLPPFGEKGKDTPVPPGQDGDEDEFPQKASAPS